LLHAWRPSTGKYVPTLCQANDASHLSLISLWTHERMFSFFFFSFFFSFFGQRIVFISYGLITSFECFSLSLCNLHCPKSFVFSSGPLLRWLFLINLSKEVSGAQNSLIVQKRKNPQNLSLSPSLSLLQCNLPYL